MSDYRLTYDGNTGGAVPTIDLPLSKSESNRLLLIVALCGGDVTAERVAECDDTRAMLHGLTSTGVCVNVGAAGTAMRFLTAWLANNPSRGEVVIDGSERMRQRPIRPLVDALRELGGCVDYVLAEGVPPLRFIGSGLMGGTITMSASVSSQYVSALMMLAPTLRDGLEIHFNDKPVSMPYIEMTAAMMRRFGAEVEVSDSMVVIPSGGYRLTSVTVEGDWSAASYWFEIVALTGKPVRLSGLKAESLQGDSKITDVFKRLGVETVFDEHGVELRPMPYDDSALRVNLEDMPDVAQTVAATSAMLRKPFVIEGLSTLPSKETDRLKALHDELLKLGVATTVTSSAIMWDGTLVTPVAEPSINTYHDHRMAMAFAPAAVCRPGLVINDIEVVSKSYPEYWNHLDQFGFTII